MAASYETLELIATHHAEIERLCDELLELASRVRADDPVADLLREQARALGYRLREHVAIEANAIMVGAPEDTDRQDAIRVEKHRLERALAAAEQKASPHELANAVCTIARDHRQNLDRASWRP
jgi:hypothetical protein